MEMEVRATGRISGDGKVEGGTPANGSVVGRLTIPAYFTEPEPENDVSLEALDDLYFKLGVLSVGETVVDFISHERVQSLRTAAQFIRYLGGQPANVAVYVAKLGAFGGALEGRDRLLRGVPGGPVAAPRRRRPAPTRS